MSYFTHIFIFTNLFFFLSFSYLIEFCLDIFPSHPIPGIVSEKGIKDEVPPVLQYQILQLALDLPASKFSWFRIQVKK